MSPKHRLSVRGGVNAPSTRAKRNSTPSSVRLCWSGTVGKSFAHSLGIGRRHDFKLYQASGVRFAPQTESLQDKGYQGIHKWHSNSRLPHKRPRGGQLSQEQKADNRALARRRVVIEQVNRCLKIFRILAQRYRNRRRRFGLRCNLIAALYNYECAQTA